MGSCTASPPCGCLVCRRLAGLLELLFDGQGSAGARAQRSRQVTLDFNLTPVCVENLIPDVMVMESAEDGV